MRSLAAVIRAEFLVSHFPEGSRPLDRPTCRLDRAIQSNPKARIGIPLTSPKKGGSALQTRGRWTSWLADAFQNASVKQAPAPFCTPHIVFFFSGGVLEVRCGSAGPRANPHLNTTTWLGLAWLDLAWLSFSNRTQQILKRTQKPSK